MEKLITEVATLKENARWQNNKLDSIEKKVDALIDEKAKEKFFKGKVVGACMALSFIATVIVEFIKK